MLPTPCLQSYHQDNQLHNTHIIRILSPLILFVIHVAYLVFISKDSFFNKWIDGSFSFFLALVLCNIIRARIVAVSEPADEPDEDPDQRDNGHGDSAAR